MAHVRYCSMAAGLALAALLGGCASGGSASGGSTSGGSAGGQASTPAAAGYWTHSRLLGAQPARDWSLPKLVRVTGYPASADAPVTCMNRTSQQSARQVRFECGGFLGGTSGSPWVTGFDPRTRTGTIVGVIGGYQEGGDTDAISYSAYLNSDIRQLYEQAAATG